MNNIFVVILKQISTDENTQASGEQQVHKFVETVDYVTCPTYHTRNNLRKNITYILTNTN